MALVPPHDLDAERAVLSAVMLRGADALSDLGLLAPTDFYSESHRRIFEAASDLAKAREIVDVVTVAARLKDSKRLEQVGGMGYLGGVLDGAPAIGSESLRAYAKILTDLSSLRQAVRVMHEAVAQAYARPGDVTSWLAETEKRILAISTRTAQARFRTIREVLFAEVRDWLSQAENPKPRGVPYGFRDVDNLLGGMHEGDFHVLGARPAMGKTSYALQAATNVAARGLRMEVPEAAAVFSLEMPAEQLAGRVLCSHARLTLSKARSGRFAQTELVSAQASCSELAKLGLFIDDGERGRPTVHDIAQRTRRLAADLAREGRRLRLVVVDYFQIVRIPPESARQRLDVALGEISIEMKQLAKELKITVLALAQLNRSLEARQDKRPVMSDLRECGQLEQDADAVTFLYRDDYYNHDSDEPNTAELIVAKNRHGPPGVAKLRFDKQWVRFDDLASEYDERT